MTSDYYCDGCGLDVPAETEFVDSPSGLVVLCDECKGLSVNTNPVEGPTYLTLPVKESTIEDVGNMLMRQAIHLYKNDPTAEITIDLKRQKVIYLPGVNR
jgi:excinuclease UvrABC ATPase subunit